MLVILLTYEVRQMVLILWIRR